MSSHHFQSVRLARRLGFFVLTLVVVELCLGWLAPPLAPVTPGDRLPADRETVMLPFWLDALKQPTTAAKVVFLGSSPTWGTAMPEAATTYPVRFMAHWNRIHPTHPVQAHNLAAKGFLAADLNAVLAASLPLGDAFVIQLNYHTFSPALLATTPIRHADLPERLGVNVTYADAQRLGMRPSPLVNLNTPLRQGLRQGWRFYREREAYLSAWLGTSPEQWLYTRFFPAAAASGDEEAPSPEPFYALKPARQLYIMQRYRHNASFELTDDNTELYFVRRMIAQLRQAGKPAVFYVAPINLQALDYYESLDRAQFKRNLDTLRAVVEQAGFHWVDLNRNPFSEELFADVSHTLPAGGDPVGKALFNGSHVYLRERLP